MFTYLPDLLTQRDRVRFLYEDTDDTAPLLQDEELAPFLTGGVFAAPDDHAAAIAAARKVLKKFAYVSFDVSIEGDSFKLSQRIDGVKAVLLVLESSRIETVAANTLAPAPHLGSATSGPAFTRGDNGDPAYRAEWSPL